VAFRDCVFNGNEVWVHGGAVRCEGGSSTFERCVFTGNLAGNQAGAVYAGPGTVLDLTDCDLIDNSARYGGGLYAARPDGLTCTGCRFEGNDASVGAGAIHANFCDPVFTGCAFVANTATQSGGAAAVFGGSAAFAGCTFALNDAPAASGIRINTGIVQLSECILAYQSGGDVVDCTSATAQLTCSVLFANQAGDFVGCLAGQDGTAGNFSADPRFCDWSSGEVALRPDSPCLPSGNSCGVLIGAYSDTGCSPTIPVLVDTSPTGLNVILDGFTFQAPTVAEWPPGTTHTVDVQSPQLPVPDERYTFAAWSDSGAISHQVTAPDSADTLVASFTAEYQLTPVAGTGGTVTPSTPAFYSYAAVESLTAAADSGFGFAGWVGAGTGSYTGPDNPIAVTMYSPITQTATFQVQNYTVTMVADSGGTVIPTPGDHVYVSQTRVTIRAVPDVGWKFTDWSGAGLGSYTGTANSTQITVLSDITQTAHFEPLPRFILTMQADSGGTVTPPTGEYIIGTQVTITATPLPGFGFTGWTGSGSGSYTGLNNPATVVMNEPLFQTAHFAPLFPLTMVADSGGTVTPASGEYTEGSIVTIEAFPDPGRMFTGWTGTGSGSYTGPDNPATVTVNGPITQTAGFFAPDSFPLTMDVSPAGVGSVLPGSGMYANGDSLVIEAIPGPNYKFLGWLGVGVGSYLGIKNPATIVMYDTISQTAFFQELPKFTLTMIAGTGGAVTPATAQYYTGTQVTITAIPDSGNGFVRWSGQGFGSYSGPDSSTTLTIIADVTQTAYFEYDVPVTIATNPAGLRVGADGTDYVSPQTFQWRNTSFHAVDVDSLVPGAPGERDRFAGWADGTATVARTIDVPDTGITYTADYSPELFLDFQDPPEGVSTPGDSWHPVGASVPIEAVPNPGFVFNSWTGQGSGSYTGPDNPASVTMNEPLVQTASYDGYGYEFSISASSTDPFVNTRTPTGGASQLYLWMTCTDVGIAAFEADVSTTLPYSSFAPEPGVLNAGGSIDLFLAIAGCPGASAPFLIGAFNIADTGGELCLVPSAANGRLGAVSCVMPTFLVDPVQVTGFSSSGQPPCFVAGTPCLLPAPAAGDPEPAQAAPPAVAAAPVFRDALVGVYPNPFPGRTTVRFSNAVAGPARLAIYDVTGRLVRVVLDRTIQPGDHRTEWDGRSAGGMRVPAGVYFVRLQVGSLDDSRKIVLINRGR
jgi:hypothetical protein